VVDKSANPLQVDSIRILARGLWDERHVGVRVVPSGRRIVPDVDAAIDRAWAEVNARPGVNLFDGPVCRLESFRADDARLELDVSATSYRVVVGTNFLNPQLADDVGLDVMANPVGVSAGLISADGFLLMGRRNHRVAYYPHMLHPFAGSLEVRPDINLFDDVRRELREELSLSADELSSIELIGIVEDTALRHPESLFRVRSNRTRRQIADRLDRAEHSQIEAIELTPSALGGLRSRQDVTPVGRAIAGLIEG
jgi:ADP-ribose pyrophosphatase YjhB (NUDIX family)